MLNFSKVAIYRIKGPAVSDRRKFSEILKRRILQNPCQKISVLESVCNKITGIDFRPLLKRNFHQGGFPLHISQF